MRLALSHRLFVLFTTPSCLRRRFFEGVRDSHIFGLVHTHIRLTDGERAMRVRDAHHIEECFASWFFYKFNRLISEPVGGKRLFVTNHFIRRHLRTSLWLFDYLFPVAAIEHKATVCKVH